MKEELFNCKKCRIQIGGHNQYLHDGMCDDCYFKEYFPEENEERFHRHELKNKTINEPESITWIILTAVKELSTGKIKLAEFLNGSKAQDVAYLSNKPGYGGLFWYSTDAIIGFAEQLENMLLIKRKIIHENDFHGILELAEAGEKVLNEKIKINLQVIKKEKILKVGDTEKATFELFKQKKSIPEIAYERKLAVSTIYEHMVNLISNNYLRSADIIPEARIVEIKNAYSTFKIMPKLKEIKEILPDEISYGEIKCVLADKELK